MQPEQKARVHIDGMLEEAGWRVVDRTSYAPNMTAVAIREGLMKGNREADYLFFLNGKAVGVLEAKREEVDVISTEVQEQALLYTRSCPSWCQAWFPDIPLPIAYVSNGKELMFYDTRKSNAEFAYLKHIFLATSSRTMDEHAYYAVEKMRFPRKGERSTIIYNGRITIDNIPEASYEYIVNGKSTIEWIMERYAVTTDKKSGIKNDPNLWSREQGKPRYILDLLLSIIHVSIETQKIVGTLPKLKFS